MLLAPWPAKVLRYKKFKAVLAEDGSPLFRGPRCGEEGSSRRCLQRMACPCSVGSGATVCGGGAHLVSHVLTWGHTAHLQTYMSAL